MTGLATTTRLTDGGMAAFAAATGSRPVGADAGPLHLAAETLPDCIALARSAVPEELHAAGLQVGHEIRLLHPLAAGTDLESRGDAEVRQAAAGTFVTVRLTTSAGTRAVAEQSATFLFRAQSAARPAPVPLPLAPPANPGDILTRFPDGAAQAYADASGDRQAIHLDDEAARAAGFPRTIVHGLCALSYVMGAVSRHVGAGPDRVTFVGARFAAPVFWDDALRTRVQPGDSPHEHEFISLNEQGTPVLTHGRVRLDG